MNLRDSLSMKYVLLSAVALLVLACGNKTKTSETDTDTLSKEVVETLAAQADGVEAAPADLWTEDAVKADIKKMYDRLNQMAKAGSIDLRQMDEEFCTGYYLQLAHAIAAHDANAKGDTRFYGDEEGYRWMTAAAAPFVITDLKAELLTGNMARAHVKLKTEDDEDAKYMALDLWMEGGRWRVNNFDEPEAFGTGGYIGMMEKYARDNHIAIEEEEPTEGAPV